MFQADSQKNRLRSDNTRKQKSQLRPLGLERLEERTLMTLQGNQLFPADNPWNEKITNAPVAANSNALVASIGASSPLHPDFGTTFNGALNGIPYNVVSGSQAKVNVVIDAYADESDLVPVPIPAGAIIEGDPSSQNSSDRHLIVYDQDHNVAYELFNVHRPSEEPDNQWHADSEAVWDMSKDSFRPPGFTSADAAGLPILPGLVRPDEVLDQGVINHALRFTVPNTDDNYVFPASHEAGVNNSAEPRMGERFRLKQSFDISGFPAADQVILQALKDYGMIVADNGSSWFLSGDPSSRWSDDDLHQLTTVVGSDFEVVNLSPIVSSVDQTSGSTGGGTAVTIQGQDFSGAAGQLQVFFGATAVSPANISILSDTTLVVTAPAHSAGTVDVTVQTPYGTSTTSASDRFTFTTGTSGATIAGIHLFYNQSKYDGNNAAINAADDAAIATDKSPYLAGSGATTFANVSSYTLGINGIMVDLGGSHGAITPSDFIFKTGNNNAPTNWTTVAAPATVMTRLGAGTNNSDRVEITWANNAIQQTWLEVIVKGNDTLGQSDTSTGLAASKVFFFGSSIADDGMADPATAYTTDPGDVLGARNNPKSVLDQIPVTYLYDYDRSGTVDPGDVLAARSHPTSTLNAAAVLNIGGGGPFVPDTEPGASPAAISASGVGAAALPAASSNTDRVDMALASGLINVLSGLPASLPSWLQDRLQGVLNTPPVVKILSALEQSDTSLGRIILQTINETAVKYDLNDDALDGRLAELGL